MSSAKRDAGDYAIKIPNRWSTSVAAKMRGWLSIAGINKQKSSAACIGGFVCAAHKHGDYNCKLLAMNF